MSNFPFGHNVFKSCLLLLRQNASAGGTGLKRRREHITANTKFDQKLNVSSLEEEIKHCGTGLHFLNKRY